MCEVIDTIAPVFNDLNEFSFEALDEGTVFDYSTIGITVDDLSHTTIDFDSTNVNPYVAGNYKLTVLASDIYNNTSTKDINIEVIAKEVVIELPELEVAPSIPETNTSPVVGNTYTYIKLEVPYYNQMSVNAPMGCEPTSLYMALLYKGYNVGDLTSFINNQPRSDSPYTGFSGDPFKDEESVEDYYAIFPAPLAAYGNNYGSCINMTNASVNDIIEQLKKGNPVVTFVTLKFSTPTFRNYYFGSATSNAHAVLVTGYDEENGLIFINDPYYSSLNSVSVNTFATSYNALQFAVAVQ